MSVEVITCADTAEEKFAWAGAPNDDNPPPTTRRSSSPSFQSSIAIILFTKCIYPSAGSESILKKL